MSFEYFNTSHLAFGSKLTRAFKQLEKLCVDCEGNILRFTEDVEYLGQYVNRNYRVPVPNSAENPVRVNEMFDAINDTFIIKELELTEDESLVVALNYFNRITNRFTVARGSTTLKKGYAFMRESVSNSNPASSIDFVQDKNSGSGRYLFKFRIDSNNFINIETSNESIVKFNTGDINHINNIEVGDSISLPYTATDYTAVLLIGNMVDNGTSINAYVNGKLIYSHGGTHIKKYVMTYLSPDDVLNSTAYSSARIINYNRAEE